MERTIVCGKVLMHMMDIEHHQVLFSNGFIDLNPTSLEYYDKKLEKIFNHPNLKEIEVGNFSSIILRSKQILESDEKYIEHSKVITQEWFDIASKIQDMPNANVLFMDVRVDGYNHLVILKLNHKYMPVMVNEPDDQGHDVMRITSRQMVPGKAQGIDEAIVVNVDTNQVFIIEKRFLIDGKMGYYLNDQYLKGTPKMTDREKLRIMNKAVKDIDEHYHVNKFESPVLIKQAITDCLVENKEVKPIEVAQKILASDYAAQEECVEMMKDLGVGENDVVNAIEAVERYSKCKIITDTEVEIILPVDDYLNEVTIKKVMNEDGTMSLILSNIHEVVVK